VVADVDFLVAQPQSDSLTKWGAGKWQGCDIRYWLTPHSWRCGGCTGAVLVGMSRMTFTVFSVHHNTGGKNTPSEPSTVAGNATVDSGT
jgi:hypothetical protein